MLRTRVVVALVLVGSVLSAGGAATASPDPAPRPHRLAVTGFALDGMPTSVVRRDAHALATVTVDGVGVRADGRSVAAPEPSLVRLRRAAHARHLRAELLVSNYSSRRGDFDPRIAHRLLSDDASIRRVARRLAGFVADGGWDGVNVDLERVPAGDAAGLVALVRALQAAMPAENTVSIDISASTSVRAYRRQGYALAGLADAADVVAVMTYDQHGPTWSGPGPVGDLRWQRAAIRAALTRVPAAQLDLGVAGYGYTWPRRGHGHTVTPRRARALARGAGVRPVWHPKAGEWSARLPNGTRLWWSDARSYRQRVVLARRLGVHGLALWRLGSADPL